MKNVTCIIICLLIIGHGLLIDRRRKELNDAKQVIMSRVPHIKDIQKLVGVEPDGIIGPETIKAWNEAYCMQEGVKACREAGMK